MQISLTKFYIKITNNLFLLCVFTN